MSVEKLQHTVMQTGLMSDNNQVRSTIVTPFSDKMESSSSSSILLQADGRASLVDTDSTGSRHHPAEQLQKQTPAAQEQQQQACESNDEGLIKNNGEKRGSSEEVTEECSVVGNGEITSRSCDHHDEQKNNGGGGGVVGPRERLKRHRGEVAGNVWIPDMWGQEDFLKDWIDCTAFDASLVPQNIMLARASLMEEGRRANSASLRVENSC